MNFLNSAIGSRVTSRRNILIIAGIGILCGALASSGMMEVARKGIFNPELFSFHDVMVIFLAVMIADVVLLDLFNTFGLPTSTTVSIVFELLGASVMVAVLLVIGDSGANSVLAFINGRQALAIIAGIFLSIGVAFSVGAAVQFLSRLLFGFEQRHGRGSRLVWAALALAVISFFLFIKVLGGAAFVPAAAAEAAAAHPIALGAALFGLWSFIVVILDRTGVEPLRVVVLAGTFALAMAFASNDLVNFIGVPLAGISAYGTWLDSGIDPAALKMEALRAPVQGATRWLLAAGIVMVVTLWLSAKAQSVTDTEVNLGRQGEGMERFQPGPAARILVRAFLAIAQLVQRVFPAAVQQQVSQRFQTSTQKMVGEDTPAFDLIRASVNLTVAASLIAVATSLKLPLSTTYVSFMVAMGTSLADRAWGRDSAAYRVSGVLSVIGGWFFTAAAAFGAAALVALVIHQFALPGLLVMVSLVALALVHSSRLHRQRSELTAVRDMPSLSGVTADDALARVRERLAVQLNRVGAVLLCALDVLQDGRTDAFDRGRREQEALERATRIAQERLVAAIKQSQLVAGGSASVPLRLLSAEQDLQQSAEAIQTASSAFVRNGHLPPSRRIQELLAELKIHLCDAVDGVRQLALGEALVAAPTLPPARAAAEALLEAQLQELHDGGRSVHNAGLILNIGLASLDVVGALERVADLSIDPTPAATASAQG
ncbi:MAG: inorganic phosphate transporter [Halieaceae bacterium]|nr:inorganic phosphate transporter [Halieaceae bacterium]